MSALQNEIDKLKTLRESYDELSKKVLDTQAVLTELNHGKQEMVDALAMKNVQSSTNKTLSAIADDVRSIAQSPITIEGGEMYEKQLFGAPTDKTNSYEQPDTPLWNLYQVMANLISDGRFVTYGGIILIEYAKVKDTIQISGAGAGGAYLTSDGSFYDVDTIHTWNDTLDSKSNRWIAYFIPNDKVFVIDDASSCPLGIFIGRNVYTIHIKIASIINKIVQFEGSTLGILKTDRVKTGLCGNTFLEVKEIPSGSYCIEPNNQNLIYIKAEKIEGDIFCGISNTTESLVNSIVIESPIHNGRFFSVDHRRVYNNLTEIKFIVQSGNFCINSHNSQEKYLNLKKMFFEKAEDVIFQWGSNYNNNYDCKYFKYLYIGYDTNDKTKSFVIKSSKDYKFRYIDDVELQQGWNKPLTLGTNIIDFELLTEENMINHILKRLKQDEEMCGSGVTITLGATNLAKLTSEEAVALLDSLTNTYGYTFA